VHNHVKLADDKKFRSLLLRWTQLQLFFLELTKQDLVLLIDQKLNQHWLANKLKHHFQLNEFN